MKNKTFITKKSGNGNTSSHGIITSDAERQAWMLMDTFPIGWIEALTIVIIRTLYSHSIICTKKRVKDILVEQFKTDWTQRREKEMTRMFDLIADGRTKFANLSARWVEYLFEDVPPEDGRVETEHVDASRFYKLDRNTVSIIRHAISLGSPLAFMVCDFLKNMSLKIVMNLLKKEGIQCKIAAKLDSDDADAYAVQAIEAMKLGKIVLFSENRPAHLDRFVRMAQVFGFRFGALDVEEDTKKLMEELDISLLPKIQTIPIIRIEPAPLAGDELRVKAAECFSDDPKFLRIITNAKVNVATLCNSKTLIREIVKKKDWEALSRFLMDAWKISNTEDSKKRQQTRSDEYDIRIINSDISPELLDRMARKAHMSHSPWKLLIAGVSGTGKSAYAYHLANKLDMEILVKRPQDVIFRYFGESETAIANAFREAESKNALLLFDEADGYLSRKTDVFSGADKGYNDITNAFMVNLEEYGGFVIATTNHLDIIEPAIIRRFHKSIEFKFPTYKGMMILFEKYFPGISFDKRMLEQTCSSGTIGPGDFIAIKELVGYMEPEEATPEFIISSLMKNADSRKASERKSPVIRGFHS